VNYIDAVAARLGLMLDDCDIDLLRIYALLVLVTGTGTTDEHVHHAWGVWRAATRPDHPDLVPFDQLTPEVQALDTWYAQAIRAVAASPVVAVGDRRRCDAAGPVTRTETHRDAGSRTEPHCHGGITTANEINNYSVLRVAG
jgi:hypothetical protein